MLNTNESEKYERKSRNCNYILFLHYTTTLHKWTGYDPAATDKFFLKNLIKY